MPRIPESELERLKTEVSLVRLVEASGIVLTRQGKDVAGRCPFHEDATASLIVTEAKNLYHCFGCGAAGGPIDWVMKWQGVSFRHATELLREGLPLAAAGSAAPVKQSTVRHLAVPVAADADDRTTKGSGSFTRPRLNELDSFSAMNLKCGGKPMALNKRAHHEVAVAFGN